MTRARRLIRLLFTCLALLSALCPVWADSEEHLVIQIQGREGVAIPPLVLDVVTSSHGTVTATFAALEEPVEFVLGESITSVAPGGEVVFAHQAQLHRGESQNIPPLGSVAVQWHDPGNSGPVSSPITVHGSVYPCQSNPLVDARVQQSSLDGSAKADRSNDPDAHAGSSGARLSIGDGEEMNIFVWSDVDGLAVDPPAVSLRFSPSHQAGQLHGEPQHLFNQPGVGEDLVLWLPTRQLYQFDKVVTVIEGQSTPAQFRVKIQHEI